MKISSELKTIKKALRDRHLAEREIKVLITQPGESNEDCFARHGVTENDKDLFIIIVKFCDEKSKHVFDEERKQKNIDDEIKSLIGELQSDGVDLENLKKDLLQ